MSQPTPELADGASYVAVAASDRAALARYRREKLELADCLLTLLHVTERRRDDAQTRRVRELAARLAEDRFQLAVVGQFSRGKSTLMNAVLGQAFLPSGALPMTSIITTVVYGSVPKAMIRRNEGLLPIETPLEDLERYVAQASTERVELQVASALVELPAEILRLGFSFVDTPGIGSAITANTETTLSFLPNADAVIFVTSFDSPLTESELAFLKTVNSEVGRTFVVLNKLDLVAKAERDGIEAFVADRLAEVGLANARVFPLSAREALLAKSASDVDRLAASGLPTFESELIAFLMTEKAREFLLATAERAKRMIASLSDEERVAARLEHDVRARTEIEHTLEELFVSKEAERVRLLAEIASTVAGELRNFAGDVVPTWRHAVSEIMTSDGEAPEVWSFVATRRRALRRSERALESRAKELVLDWSTQAVAEWLGRLGEKVQGNLDALTEVVAAFESAAVSTFGITSSVRHTASEDRPLPAARPVRWRPSGSARRRAWPLSMGRKLLDEITVSTASSHVDLLEELVYQSAGEWLRALDSWSKRELSDASSRVRTHLNTPSSPELGEELSTLEAELASLIARITSWSLPHAEILRPSPRLVAQSEIGAKSSGCVVCDELVSVLFDFMAHYQFELATRMAQRIEHATAKGFCATHTWYYAEIGSPVGISASYAPLGEQTALAIREAAAQASNSIALSEALGSTRATRRECPACNRLDRTITSLLERLRLELAQGAPEPRVPPLCIDHAACVMADSVDLEIARAIAIATAERLERRSEDMRTFSLKRESLRRSLVDNEEEVAYRDVLLRLVGDPRLVGGPHSTSELSSRSARRR